MYLPTLQDLRRCLVDIVVTQAVVYSDLIFLPISSPSSSSLPLLEGLPLISRQSLQNSWCPDLWLTVAAHQKNVSLFQVARHIVYGPPAPDATSFVAVSEASLFEGCYLKRMEDPAGECDFPVLLGSSFEADLDQATRFSPVAEAQQH